ncbi:MAG: undecaprenyl-diphosphate phosphatase [Actinomycetota bacterium]
MSLIQALLLGIVQGLTEFLPVSSDGHLVLVPFILGWKEPSLAFIVSTHIGTLAALIFVFRARIVEIIKAVIGAGPDREPDRRLAALIVIGTIPGALLGALLASQVEDTFERPVLATLFLGITGWILISAETHYEERKTAPRTEGTLTPVDAGLIGIAQATAILPGISRSGTTIATGLWRGVNREDAARFSFLLAIPITIGAILVKLPDMIDEGTSGSGGAMALGVVTAAITGVLAIEAMLALVKRRGLKPFGVYCFFAMTAGLLTALARG